MVSLLVQTPPVVAQFKVVVEPAHTELPEFAVNVLLPAVVNVCNVYPPLCDTVPPNATGDPGYLMITTPLFPFAVVFVPPLPCASPPLP